MTALIVLVATLATLAAAFFGAWLAIFAADTAGTALTRAALRRRDVATARKFDTSLLRAADLFVDARNGLGGQR